MAPWLGLSMVASTVWSGWFLKWKANGMLWPLGGETAPSQSPSSSLETAGLGGAISTLASPVRCISKTRDRASTSSAPVSLPFARVNSKVGLPGRSGAAKRISLPTTLTSVTRSPVIFCSGTPRLATHTPLAFLARSSASRVGPLGTSTAPSQ